MRQQNKNANLVNEITNRIFENQVTNFDPLDIDAKLDNEFKNKLKVIAGLKALGILGFIAAKNKFSRS